MTKAEQIFLKLGVIGDPILQSPSPSMFNPALAELGLAGQYQHYHVRENELAAFVLRLRQKEIQGINVTIPHKQTIIPLLDALTPEAKSIGAVNTVYFQNDQLIGHNTDAGGFWQSLQQHGLSDLSQQRVVLLGAGGACLAVGHTLLEHGLQTLTICNRDAMRAAVLAKSWQEKFPTAQITTADWQKFLAAGDESTTLCINTTSLGLKTASPWPGLEFLKSFPKQCVLIDIVANPIMTPLLLAAEQHGLQIIAGWEMLLYQAVLAFHKFTGQNAPQTLMQQALLQALEPV